MLNKKLFRECLRLALLILLAGNACFGAPEFRIHYDLEIIDPAAHLTRIKVNFTGFPQASVKLGLPPYYGGELIKLERVTAETASKKALKVAMEDRYYCLELGSERDFSIKYDLLMNQKNQGYMGFLCKTYLLSNAGWAFLVPEGQVAGEYRTTFKVPAKWTVVTPWKQEGTAFVEKDLQRFTNATIGAGEFDVRQRNISGTEVRIAIDKGFDKVFRDRVTDNCFGIFAYIKSLFGASGPESHLSVLVKATEPMPAQWQFTNENGLSQGEAIDIESGAYYQFGHRIFHTYNIFYPIGMDTRPLWFMEGTNEYYGALALTSIHFGAPLSQLAYKYQEIFKKEAESFDGPISGTERLPGEFAREQFLFYHKAALVNYLLDREIGVVTRGKKSLKDVLQALYKDHGQFKGGEVSDEVILQKLKTITGKDFNDWFQQNIYGTGNLDLQNLFADDDSDGVCNGGEDFLGTSRKSADSDKDGASDGMEYQFKTDPLDKRVKADRPMYVDGFSQDWDSIKSQKVTGNLGNGLKIFAGVDYARIGSDYYILLRTKKPAIKEPYLRYYANIDVDSDSIAELQIAAVYQKSGDTSKFTKDWSNYDMQTLGDLNGPESAVSDVIEYKIPVSWVGNKKRLAITFGIWDTANNQALEQTNWQTLNFP